MLIPQKYLSSVDKILAVVVPRAMSCNVLGVKQNTVIPTTVISKRAQHSCCSLPLKLWLFLIIFMEHLYSLIYVLSISFPCIYNQSFDYPGNKSWLQSILAQFQTYNVYSSKFCSPIMGSSIYYLSLKLQFYYLRLYPLIYSHRTRKSETEPIYSLDTDCVPRTAGFKAPAWCFKL